MQAPLTAASFTARNFTASNFTAFDWFLVAVLAVSTFAAFTRGIVKVLFSLAGLIAGLLLASWNYPVVAESLHRYITSFAVAQVAAFLLILVGVALLFSFLARIVRKAVSTVGLGFLDRLFGAAFGFVRGLLLGCAVMMAIAAFLPGTTLVQGSRLAPYFLSGAHAISFLVPEHLQQLIANGARDLLKQTPELFRHPTLNSM